MRRTRHLTAAMLTGLLLLAGCSGDERPGDSGESPAEESGPQTWPLTGLTAEEGESVERPHPVLVVKVDNTPSSSPQAGLGKADLVVEELVEGGVTRLAVFFYEELPSIAGPVRSMRASDIGIVTPIQAAVVTSGAAGQTIARVEDAGIQFFGEGAEGMFRDDARSAPYNLFARLPTMAEAAETDPARPDDYLPWGEEGASVRGRPASGMDVAFGSRTTSWEFRDGAYRVVNGFAAEGDQFVADTVLVLRVRVGDAGYTDPAGNPVPETKFEGAGAATLFHDGRLVRGRWSKASLESPLELTAGQEALAVPPGRVWIELMPATSGSLTVRR